MIGKESVFFCILYIKLFELGVKVDFYDGSAVAYYKVDLLKYTRWGNYSESTNDTLVLLIRSAANISSESLAPN